MERFCVKCGKSTAELISSLCVACYVEKNTVLDIPPKLVLEFDHISGRIKQGRLWLERSDGLIEKIVKETVLKAAAPQRMAIENIKVLLEHHDDNIIALVNFEAVVEGINVKIERKINLILRKSVSDATTKLSSDYFEATIQIRFLNDPTSEEMKVKLDEVTAFLANEKKRNEMSQATAVKKSRKGFDMVIGSFKAADKVSNLMAKKHRLKVIYSNSLYGVNDSGKNKYRHTYCIKFPN